MLDLEPATRALAEVLGRVRDDQLAAPTPCTEARDEGAWSGTTRAGGIDLPGEVAGLVAIDEAIVHGWDTAVATGQPYDVAPELVTSAARFVESAVEDDPHGTPGLFGPPVAVPDDAPPLARLIGLTGRDPAWLPGGRDA